MADKSAFSSYFAGLYRENRFAILLLCLLSAIISGISSVNIGTYEIISGETGKFVQNASNLSLSVPAYIGLYAAMLSAIFSFARFKQRRNLDMLLAMPISRKSVGRAHYLFGLLNALAPLITAYACNLAAVLIKTELETIHFGWYALSFGFAVLYSSLLYTAYVFVFNEANTVFDGCAFVFLWHNVFYWVMYARAKDSINARLLSPERFLERIIKAIEMPAGNRNDYVFRWLFKDPEVVAAMLGWLFLGIFAAVLFEIRFGKGQYERASEVSDSIFGYNLLIPLYTVSGALFGYSSTPADELGYPMEILFLVVAAFALYSIFRRGIRFKITDYTVMTALVVLLITSVLMRFQH